MEELVPFFLVVVGVSVSGVIAPGPLFAINVTHGLRRDSLSGIKVVVGHTLVEFPLVLLIGLGTITLEAFPESRIVISIVGAISLFVFSALQLRLVFKKDQDMQTKTRHGPLISGIIFTGLNPFFLIWWLTVGFKIISDALVFWSFSGIVIMFLMHIWMDYAWLGGTAVAASKIRNFLSNRIFRLILIGLCAVMTYYGIVFIIDGLTAIQGLD